MGLSTQKLLFRFSGNIMSTEEWRKAAKKSLHYILSFCVDYKIPCHYPRVVLRPTWAKRARFVLDRIFILYYPDSPYGKSLNLKP